MRRWIIPFLIVTLLAACVPADLSTPAPATVAPDLSALKIIPFFTTESDPNQLAVLQDLISEYQSLHSDIEIDIVLASPSSRGRRLLTALASGADLGIFEIEPTLISEWIESGYVIPLDDVVEAISRDEYLPGSLTEAGGHVYAVPYATSIYGLWVRQDLLARAGLPLPTTYEELLHAAQTLTDGSMYGIALPAGQNAATVNYFSTFLWQNGGDYFSCDGRVTFGEPQALEALTRWDALAQYAPPGYSTWSYSEQIDAFLSGRVAMAMYGGRLGVQLSESHPELENKVTVVFPPFGPEKVTLGVWSRFAIAAGTKHQTEAKDFLQWLVSGNRLLRYDMTLPGHMIPPLKSVRQQAVESTDPYVVRHRDWIQSFYSWVDMGNHPAMNMGSVTGGQFRRSNAVPPWAWEVFGTPGIVDTMLQNIANGREVESAWQEALAAMNQTVAAWKSTHPDWQATCE
jgi:ABC-type glycerol-3-phosphate transport system substrate-binding protein